MKMSVSLKQIGFDDAGERTLFLLSAANPADLSGMSVATGSKYFVAFVAWDARAQSGGDVARLARMLLDAGCVYFCCWGPGCERVHDIIDEEYSKDGLSVVANESAIMTTWHDDESLEESVWFALNAAFPDDRFFDDCKSVVAVCIGSASWATEISKALERPRALVARVADGGHNAT
jgi:hypothetical protein